MRPVQNDRVQELLWNQPVAPQAPAPSSGAAPAQKPEFESLLQDRLKLSGHAKTRLESRNISLGKEAWDRVMSGVDRAAAKGAKESLVLVDDVALVVSVRNRTVITAVDKQGLRENVFTNIDSAVIV